MARLARRSRRPGRGAARRGPTGQRHAPGAAVEQTDGDLLRPRKSRQPPCRTDCSHVSPASASTSTPARPARPARRTQSWTGPPSQPGGQRHVLVADDTAEDGLNLQVADAVLHLRLPWSPNQLEQRLGRVDRYPAAAAASVSGPARQYLIGNGDPDESFPDAWAALLEDGYQIFSGSVSTLQDAIAAGLERTWMAGLQAGTAGLREDGEPGAGGPGRRPPGNRQDGHAGVHPRDLGRGPQISPPPLSISSSAGGKHATPCCDTPPPAAAGSALRHYSRTVDGSSREIFDLPQSRPLLTPRLWNSARRRRDRPHGARRIQPVGCAAGTGDAPAAPREPTRGRPGRGDRH